MAEDVPRSLDLAGVSLPADFPVECRWISDRLAIGSMIGTIANMGRLRELGMTHVVNLQAEFDDRTIVGDTGMEILHLPFPNHPEELPESQLALLMERVPALLADGGSRLFLHCMAGHHRAPTAAYAVLRRLGWSPEEAESRILVADPRAQLTDENLRRIDRLAEISDRSR